MIEYHGIRAMHPVKSIIPAVNGWCLGPVLAHLDQVMNVVDELTEVLTNWKLPKGSDT